MGTHNSSVCTASWTRRDASCIDRRCPSRRRAANRCAGSRTGRRDGMTDQGVHVSTSASSTAQPGTVTGYQESREWRVQAAVAESWIDVTSWSGDDDGTREHLEWLRGTAAPGVRYRRICRHLMVATTVED